MNYKRVVLFFILLFFNEASSFGQVWSWGKTAGGYGYTSEGGYGITTDKRGNSYVTGAFADTIIVFGNDTLKKWGTINDDTFIAKYDSNGSVVWAKSIGGVNGSSGNDGDDIVVDKKDNVYVTGTYSSVAIFGNDTIATNGYDYCFLAKYDSLGNEIWVKSVGCNNNNTDGDAVAVDNKGNILVTGVFNSNTLVVGSDTMINYDATGSSADIFVVKYSPSGNLIWAKSGGGNSDDYPSDISADNNGNLYITGSFYSPILKFGNTTLNGTGSDDFYLIKLDSNGNSKWGITASGTSRNGGSNLAIDLKGNIYVSGAFSNSSISFGSITLTNPGFFLLKTDSSGNILWAKQAGGTTEDDGGALTIGEKQNICVTGWFQAPYITFDMLTVVNSWNRGSMFIVNYDSNGTALWATTVAGSSDNAIRDISTDIKQNYFITGDFVYSPIIFGDDTLIGGYFKIFVAKLNANILTGINNLNNSRSNISCFPIPSTGIFTIAFIHSELASGTQTIEIYNEMGQKVTSETIRQVQGDYTINLSNQPNGVYFYRVLNESGALFGEGKLIIAK